MKGPTPTMVLGPAHGGPLGWGQGPGTQPPQSDQPSTELMNGCHCGSPLSHGGNWPREAKRRAGVTQPPGAQAPRLSARGPAPALTHHSPAAAPGAPLLRTHRHTGSGRASGSLGDSGISERTVWRGPRMTMGDLGLRAFLAVTAFQRQQVSGSPQAPSPKPWHQQPCGLSSLNLPDRIKLRPPRKGIYLPGNPALLESPSSTSPGKQRTRTSGSGRSPRARTARENTGVVSARRDHSCCPRPGSRSPKAAILTFPPP